MNHRESVKCLMAINAGSDGSRLPRLACQGKNGQYSGYEVKRF
jgi:hypothetical protein